MNVEMSVDVKSTWKEVIVPYIVYFMTFLGMGLLSGAIVHMPLDTKKYTIVLTIGVVMFIIAALLNETIIEKKELSIKNAIRLIVFSIVLSVGIGMISGGIQHFDDEPKYATYLIPLGIIISLFGFIVKNNLKLKMKKIITLFTIVAILTGFIGFYLKTIAANMPEGTEEGLLNTTKIVRMI
jgi:uncharacterized membrane protein